MKKKGFCLLCVAVLLLCAFPARAERVFPAALRFSQKLTRKRTDDGRLITVTLPCTSRQDVNRKMASLIRSMEEEGTPLVKPSLVKNVYNRGDFGSYITRVGDRWMSFLTIGRVTENGEQAWLSADARVYDMETGSRVYLENMIDGSIGGWDLLASEVRSRLSALFPGDPADPDLLDALCTRKALSSAGLSVSPGHLALIWPASALYPDHAPGLLRVEIYYPLLQRMLTKEALAEMDCSGYTLVALTYDDGPARGTTDLLLDELLIAGAPATFFVIGRNLEKNRAVVRREYDAGFSVQSHTWSHAVSLLGTREMPPEKILEEKQQMDDFLGGLTGAVPSMMRAPGGFESFFLEAEVPLPLVHWSMISGDASKSNLKDARPVWEKVVKAHDGEIVLLHDAYALSPAAARKYLPKLEKRSVLLVTVNDLCALRGVPLLAGSVICGCP